VDGLVHIWTDAGAVPTLSTLAANGDAFVVPTLVNFLQRNTGGEEGRALLADPRVRERLSDAFQAGVRDAPWVRNLNDSVMRARREDAPRFRRQLYDAVAGLHRSGVRILAGTDAANWGMSPVFLHRELELLVAAGLTPAQALAAATSAPADAFRLGDRGRIRPGLRADLVLVTGDPTRDITDTRGIVAVWKEGIPLGREPSSDAGTPPPATTGPDE
jgi:imidazolonepropionase-like amidohydrolase